MLSVNFKKKQTKNIGASDLLICAFIFAITVPANVRQLGKCGHVMIKSPFPFLNFLFSDI